METISNPLSILVEIQKRDHDTLHLLLTAAVRLQSYLGKPAILSFQENHDLRLHISAIREIITRATEDARATEPFTEGKTQ